MIIQGSSDLYRPRELQFYRFKAFVYYKSLRTFLFSGSVPAGKKQWSIIFQLHHLTSLLLRNR